MSRSAAALAALVLSFLAGLPLTLSAQVDEEDLLPTAPFALGAAASDESELAALAALADGAGGVHFPRAVVHAPAQDAVEVVGSGLFEEEREYQIAGGLSRVIIDETFSLGAEAKVQPTERSHIDFTPLIGLNNDSPSAEIFLIMGWEF